MTIDVRTALGLFDPSDLTQRPCDECGAKPGERCTLACTAWPAVMASGGTSDELGGTAAGRLAVAVAHDLRAAHLDASATTSGGDCVAIVLTYPSGRDWIVAAVETWDDVAVFYVGQYADQESADAVVQVEIHDCLSAVRAIIDMAARTRVSEVAR